MDYSKLIHIEAQEYRVIHTDNDLPIHLQLFYNAISGLYWVCYLDGSLKLTNGSRITTGRHINSISAWNQAIKKIEKIVTLNHKCIANEHGFCRQCDKPVPMKWIETLTK